jgi:hypothetical protein
MFGGLLLLSSHVTFPTAIEDMVMALLRWKLDGRQTDGMTLGTTI